MNGNQSMKERVSIALKIKLTSDISFMVNELVVMETTDKPEAWKCLGEIPL